MQRKNRNEKIYKNTHDRREYLPKQNHMGGYEKSYSKFLNDSNFWILTKSEILAVQIILANCFYCDKCRQGASY